MAHHSLSSIGMAANFYMEAVLIPSPVGFTVGYYATLCSPCVSVSGVTTRPNRAPLNSWGVATTSPSQASSLLYDATQYYESQAKK
jgi:hypothetical protein